MNFTREPVIETIITPREGCHLVVRGSKQRAVEEFTVDAVEVISFGQALFFRSLDRPHPFLVPVGDYEVIEAKESRAILKNVQFEKSIKIGGGREGTLRKEEEGQAFPIALEDEVPEETPLPPPPRGGERKRERHRRRRRPHHEEREATRPSSEPPHKENASESPKELPPLPHLIPPPTSLISEVIHRYKEQPSLPPAPPSSRTNGDGDPSVIS